MKNKTPNTRLLHAAKFGSTDDIKQALSEGASIECRNRAGATPLLLSSYHKNYAVTALLVSLGAKHTAVDYKGRGCDDYTNGLPNPDAITDVQEREAEALMIASGVEFADKEKTKL